MLTMLALCPGSAAYDILLPKKASAKRVKLPPQQEGLMDIQLDDEEEADSDVRIVGRNGERRQQARPKGAERAPAYAEVGTQRSRVRRIIRLITCVCLRVVWGVA